MWSLRKWDPEKFIIPEEKRAAFHTAIERHWAEMEKHAEWKIEKYRQYTLNKKK
jgi:hypothetical protein